MVKLVVGVHLHGFDPIERVENAIAIDIEGVNDLGTEGISVGDLSILFDGSDDTDVARIESEMGVEDDDENIMIVRLVEDEEVFVSEPDFPTFTLVGIAEEDSDVVRRRACRQRNLVGIFAPDIEGDILDQSMIRRREAVISGVTCSDATETPGIEVVGSGVACGPQVGSAEGVAVIEKGAKASPARLCCDGVRKPATGSRVRV